MHTESKSNNRYNRIVLERLNHVVPKLVDAFDPDEIIMYGSYARGDNDIYSDIDLIIIVKNINLRFPERSIKAVEIVNDGEFGDENIPINPIVYTVEEFESMLKRKESFLLSALKESVLIWKRDENTDVTNQLENGLSESVFKKFLD